MLASQFRRGIPNRLRQLCPPRSHTAILLQFALQLRNWLRYRSRPFSVHFQSPPSDSSNLAIGPILRHAGLPEGHGVGHSGFVTAFAPLYKPEAERPTIMPENT